ncbi:TolC family outer membrane protein [Gammaproteobacteria bacterium AB-CW1]|uniref:Protein CyaE n=1 Tax=Natronospira elongata TaxID=3110268 RepID=A0AAP6JG54_9GAMM|nr:TolC family outer membrane protein [Gammaproteobacteria bacterium AB-CW1]
MSLRPLILALCLLGLSAPLAEAQAESEMMNLLQIYELAVENDPAIREARANRDAAREAYPQARANLLPQLSLTVSYQDRTRERRVSQAGQVPLDAARSDDTTTTYSLDLSQVIFDWGAFQGMGRAQAEVAAAEADFEAAMQDLAIRTAEGYFDLLAALDQLASSEANEEAILRQRDRAERRFEVGLVAITDVQEARAAYDQAVADRISAERNVNVYRERLREIIGIYPGEIAAPIDDMDLQLPVPADPEAWVIQAQANNLNVVAARFDLEAAEKSLAQSRAGHYPTLELTASYSDVESSGETRIDEQDFRQPDFFEQELYQFQVQLNVPLFSGGRVSSQTTEARQRMLAQTSRVERLARQAEREARDAYLGVHSERSRVRALAQAVESSQTALTSTQAGFEVGTRTTVDVLDARRALFEAQTSYARSRYDFLLNKMRLRVATGALNANDIMEINALLGASPGAMVDDEEIDPEELDMEGLEPRT